MLPDSLTIPFTPTMLHTRPWEIGPSCDVWKVIDERNPGRVFAMKEMRVWLSDPLEKMNEV